MSTVFTLGTCVLWETAEGGGARAPSKILARAWRDGSAIKSVFLL